MTQKQNTSLEYEFQCPLASGLHARPASKMAEVANQFASEFSVTNLRNGQVANAKSVLSLIAADIRHHDQCVLGIAGSDELEAREAVGHFVERVLPHCDVSLADISSSGENSRIPRSFQAANIACISGTPASRGIARGRVVLLKWMEFPQTLDSPRQHDTAEELARVKDAISAVRFRIQGRLKGAVSQVESAVLQAELAMAGDVALADKITWAISRGKSAAQGVVSASEFYADLLARSENDYIRQRSSDVEEICLQILQELGDLPEVTPLFLKHPSVLVAETLGPQQLLGLNRQFLKALVLEQAASHSHAVILARSLGIPTLTGVRNARILLASRDEVLVDCDRGFVVPNISDRVQRFYAREMRTLELRRQKWSQPEELSSTEGRARPIEVGANASTGEEAVAAFENGADGIGLFRTEMIFLGRNDAPSEQEQFAIYSETVRAAGSHPVIIRTFDIGGDKGVPYLSLQREENPFLGFRGARLYPQHRQLLRTQLRAILRASRAGRVQIMAPMITSLGEMIEFNRAVAAAKNELSNEGIEFDSAIKVGMMIEVPAVAFILEELCADVDFFSIGTNDLAQYFFAADRNNAKVSSLFKAYEPGFLRFLQQIVQKVRAANKWIGICGELASDILTLPLLAGLDIDEISVPASEVHELKRAAQRLITNDSNAMLQRAIACKTSEEVRELLTAQTIPSPTRALLSEELILLESESLTKEEVIQEMVDALYITERTEDRYLLEEALWAREALGSTEVGYGFAIPHCKTDALTSNSICVLRLKNPIEWNFAHPERVRMVVLLALRESDPENTHMQVFSSLARKLINDDFRQNLLTLNAPDKLKSYLAAELGINAVE